MTHRDEGELQAYLDGELPGERSRELRAHLGECAGCRETLEELRARAALVESVLAADGPRPDLDAARWEVRRRWAARRVRARRQWSMRAAAVIVLVSGVVAASLPGSPVRGLMGEGWDRVVALVGGEEAEEEAAPAGEATVEEVEPATGRVATQADADGRLEVRLDDVAAGTEIRVTRVPGRMGALELRGAPEGFRSGAGMLRARVGEAPVRVELPSDAVVATLTVNGEVLVEVRDGRMRTPGLQPVEEGEDEAVFQY